MALDLDKIEGYDKGESGRVRKTKKSANIEYRHVEGTIVMLSGAYKGQPIGEIAKNRWGFFYLISLHDNHDIPVDLRKAIHECLINAKKFKKRKANIRKFI